MIRKLLIAAVLFVISVPAHAHVRHTDAAVIVYKHPHHHHYVRRHRRIHHYRRYVRRHVSRFVGFLGSNAERARRAGLPWCGAWLSDHFGIQGAEGRMLWVARNWARWGRRAFGPAIGVVTVWRHHVGVIVGQQNGMWVVESGNDGHRVRSRPRSLAGAIAFRVSL